MIRPIDLQTLYMNLDKVGKELAQTRENALHQQVDQAQKLQKIHEQKDHAVTATENTADAAEEEANTVKADSQSPHSSGQKRKNKDGRPDQREEAEKNEWKDPELGQHVDLEG